MNIDVNAVPTPSYVLDLGVLHHNLQILASVRRKTGCKILLAFKGFAMFSLFPVIRKYLQGASASSLDEARLASDEFGGEVHVYMPAYKEEEFSEILSYADHLVFNSFSQLERFKDKVLASPRNISCGIRLNPQYSEVEVELYNPCARYSRLGVTEKEFQPEKLDNIQGLHFHALCGQNADSLTHTLDRVEAQFGEYLHRMKWVNFGGGHHITRKDYDINQLCRLIDRVQDRYGVAVYLEPSEAVALHAGVLVTQVLDIIRNEINIAILDTSAAAHMPDVLEMPYRPEIAGAGLPGQYEHTYRLGGLTCLAGDVAGVYSFPDPLTVGQKLVFQDMAHYTMVKNNTFNGVRLPSIGIYDPERRTTKIIRSFSYEDYKTRLS